MRYLSIKNYAKHQHYKDRRPPWIKLHVEVLDDYEFMQLSDASKAHLMMLWVLASKMDNKIPHDLTFIAQRIGSTTAIDLEELFVRGFLETHSEDRARGKREEWPSRHVSAQVRAALLSAAQHQCSLCPATEHLEIDHIVPISKGGTGDVSNLQVLCRQCNRRKRAKLQHEATEPQRSNLLRGAQHSALLETETEGESEAETQKTLPRKAAAGTRAVVVTGPPFALAPYLAAHEERFPGGNIPAARFGRVLKGLERKHGPAETLRRWKIFLAAKGELGPEYFARTWSEWGGAPRAAAAVSTAPADEDAWSAALDVVARMARREITAESFQQIPVAVRAGLKAVGGWTAVRDMKPGDLPFRRRDFLAAYRAAELAGAA